MDSNPVVLEGEANSSNRGWTFAIQAYGKGEKISDEELGYLVDMGYCFDREQGNFTDEGFRVLEELGVPVKVIKVLTLGQDIHPRVYDESRTAQTLHIKSGSQLLVQFAGRDRKTGQVWYDVLAGDGLPPMRVYSNRLHQLSEHKWPVAWPLKGQSTVAS